MRLLYLMIACFLFFMIMAFFEMVVSKPLRETFIADKKTIKRGGQRQQSNISRHVTSKLRKYVDYNTNRINQLFNHINEIGNNIQNISNNFYKMNKENVILLKKEGHIIFDDNKLAKFSEKIKNIILQNLRHDEDDDENNELSHKNVKVIRFVFTSKMDKVKPSKTWNSISKTLRIVDKEMKHFFFVPYDDYESVKEDHDQLKNYPSSYFVKKIIEIRNDFMVLKNKEVYLKEEIIGEWLSRFPDDNIYDKDVKYTIEMHIGSLIEILQEVFEEEDDDE